MSTDSITGPTGHKEEPPRLDEILARAEWRFEGAEQVAHELIEMEVEKVIHIYRDIAVHAPPGPSGRMDQYDMVAGAERMRAQTIIWTTYEALELLGKIPQEEKRYSWWDLMNDEVDRKLRSKVEPSA